MALLPMSTPIERVAATVVERVAELLLAPVAVIGQRGTVISCSDASLVGQSLSNISLTPWCRVPLPYDTQSCEVVVGDSRDGEVISPRLAHVLVELVVNQTTVVEQLPQTHAMKNAFLYSLLRGEATDEAAIMRDARLLGIDLGTPRGVILIDAAAYICAPEASAEGAGSEAQIRRRARHIIGAVVSFFHLPNDTICAYMGDGEVAVLKASNSKNLDRWADRQSDGSPSWADLAAMRRASVALQERLHLDTGVDLCIGLGRYHPGVCGLARSYQDARAALTLGSRFHGQNGVHCLDSLGIAAFVGVSDERTKIDLATKLLSPLDDERDLLETLDVFFTEDCCSSSTAMRLNIHRNTLAYRLDKIASLTGLDPRRFDAAVQMRLALVLRSLDCTAH